jgi:phosphoglycolate phosphatase
MSLPRFKTILLDLDGTLIDSRIDLANAVNFALNGIGRQTKAESEIIPHVGNGLRTLLGNVLQTFSESEMEKAIQLFSEFYDQHCVDQTKFYKGVEECVYHLSPAVKFAIVTNKPYRFALKIIGELGLANEIPVIVGGDSLKEKKPHPAPIFRAMEELSATKTSTLMVGDGHQDVEAGQAAGIKTCAARYGYGFKEETLLLKPDFTINKFLEIKEIVYDSFK